MQLTADTGGPRFRTIFDDTYDLSWETVLADSMTGPIAAPITGCSTLCAIAASPVPCRSFAPCSPR